MTKRKRQRTTEPRNIRAREREVDALTLRKAHWTYEAIGRQLGITRQAAYARVKTALETTREETKALAKEVVELELERLDSLQRGLYQRGLRGDLGALDRWEKLSKLRHALLGLTPMRAELTGKDGAPLLPDMADARARLAKLVEAKAKEITAELTSPKPLDDGHSKPHG